MASSFDRLFDEISQGLLSLFGPWSEHMATFEWRFEGDLTLLRLRNLNGSVVVRGSDAHAVTVVATKIVRGPTESAADNFARRVRLLAEHRREAVFAHAVYPRPPLGCSVFVRYEVTVPRMIDVHLYTQSGGFTLAEIEGAVEAETRNGNITLTDSLGPARLYTASGALHIAGVEGSVDAETGRGDITLRNTTGRARVRTTQGAVAISGCMGIVEAHSYGGAIDLRRGRGGAALETARGDIRAAFQRVVEPVSLVTHDGSVDADVLVADAAIEAEALDGDIALALPADYTGQLEAVTGEGKIVCGLPFTGMHVASGAMMGRLGPGGPTTVKLHSFRGDITIRPRDSGDDTSSKP